MISDLEQEPVAWMTPNLAEKHSQEQVTNWGGGPEVLRDTTASFHSAEGWKLPKEAMLIQVRWSRAL